MCRFGAVRGACRLPYRRVSESDFLTSTRASYDAVAAEYADHFRHELARKPLDRAVLSAFAELVGRAGGAPVADVGCGPGEVTAYLAGLSVPVFGVDLSPGMVETARCAHPGLRFEVGSMTALDIADGALAGLVANYSIIHIPDERLPEVFAEFHRVLAPGGYVLLVFQVGDRPWRLGEAFDRDISLWFHRRRPDDVAEMVRAAGFFLHTRMVRAPDTEAESTEQAYVVARKTTPGAGVIEGLA